MLKFLKFKHRTRSRRSLFIALGFLILIGPSIYLYSKFASPAKADWFDDSWSFRKAIAIPSHTTLESSVYVTAPTFDATDTTKFQADCGDLRFTKQNGELLQYYVVDCDATADIHVFFDSLPAGATNYYMYYGNPNVADGFTSADFSTTATGLGTQTLAAEERSEAPVAYWKFDEGSGTTTQDSTSNNFDGTIAGATWKTEDQCISGKCLSFNGTDNRVNTTTKLTNITSEITVSAWVYPINPPSGLGRIIASTYTWNATPSLQRGWVLGNYIGSTDQIWMRVYDSSGNSSIASLDNFFANYKNKWVHIVGTFKAGQYVRLYIDGKLVVENTTSIISAIAPSANNLRIGTRADNTTQAVWDGKIDELKIYPYSRTSSQIKSDYRARGSSKGTSVSLSQNSQNDDALSNGLVAYWKMDESSGSAVDSSGNGNTGTWAGIGTHYGTGKFGGGAVFNGTDDYIQKTSFPTSLKTKFTYSAWVKTGSSCSSNYYLMEAEYAEPTMWIQSCLLKVNLRDPGGSTVSTFTGTTTLAINTWYHLAATYDDASDTVKIFVDGKQDGTGTHSSIGNQGGGTTFDIGGRTTAFFNGIMDEVRVYNHDLSPGEISKLYSFAPGPVAYYDFNEGSGTTANDQSGNGYSGTLTNSPTWKPGKIGKGLEINQTSSNQHVSLGSPNFGISTGPFTIEAWVYKNISTTAGIFSYLFDKQTNRWVLGFFDNNRPRIYLNNTWYDVSGSDISLNSWNHLVVTRDEDNNLELYVNGVARKQGLNSGSKDIGGASTTVIGTRYDGIAQPFQGKIDDFKIYNYARTQTQILEDMKGGHSVIGAKTPLAYYKFDEGHGTVANNAGFGGNGLNATISNANWTNSGKFSKALSFNGTSSYVQLGATNLDTYFDATKNWTISTWVNISAWTNEGAIFSNRYADTEFVRLYTTGTTGQLGLGTRDSGNTTINLTVSGLSTNTWYQVMINRTYNGTIDLYVNGALKASAADTRAGDFISEAGSHEYFVGRTVNNGDWVTWKYFTGLIDEVKIYNTALTAEEVKQDYNRNSLISFGGGSDTSALSGGSVASSSASATYCVPGSSDPCSPPVAEWGFDEGQGTTTDDISGNGNAGTLTNGPSWTRGKTGKALSFDGTDDYVDLGTFTKLDGATALTISTWIYKEEDGNFPTYDGIIGIGSTNQRSPWIYGNNGASSLSTQFETTTGGAGDCNAVSTTIPANAWSHITLVWNGTSCQFYLNGSPSGNADPTTGNTLVSTDGSNSIGRITGFNNWNGPIDQVRIYNYARTPSQIAWDYNGGGPVAHYKLNECQGTIANDASGNGNHGTITIGATGTNSAVGTCNSSGAWADGVTGKFGASLDFDGTDDIISMGDPASGLLDMGTNDFTLSAWIKTSSSAQMRIINKRDASSIGYEMYMTSGQNTLAMLIGDAGGVTFGDSTGTENLRDGQWHHVLITFKRSGNATYYVDGKITGNPKAISTRTSTISNAQPLYIGRYGTPATGFFDGLIDDVRIYNYALTPVQIKDLYNENSAIRFGL